MRHDHVVVREDHPGWGHGWGGSYRAPPVVYGYGGYGHRYGYAPPVVGFGIGVPGFRVGVGL